MALIDKDARNVLIGMGVGVGLAALLPGLSSIFKDAGRPLAKATIKTGLVAYEKGREKMAHWGEVVEDLVAEARMELETEAQPAAIPIPSQEPKADGGV